VPSSDDAQRAPGRLSVVVAGWDEAAVRLVEGLRRSDDLRLAAVLDDRPAALARVRALDLPTADGAPVTCDALVIRDGGRSLVCRPDARRVDASGEVEGLRTGTSGARIVPAADCLALRRVVRALAAAYVAVERVYLLILEHSTRLDCLTPLFGERNGTHGWLPPGGPPVVVQRVLVPYDRSNVHVLCVDVSSDVGRDEVLAALQAAPRVVVGRAGDGLPHTAGLQERRRDADHPAGDAPEIFVWEESVAVEGRRLYLTVDVCPLATPVPETLDAVREVAAGHTSEADPARAVR